MKSGARNGLESAIIKKDKKHIVRNEKQPTKKDREVRNRQNGQLCF